MGVNPMRDRAETDTIAQTTFEKLWERYHRPLTWFVNGYLGRVRNGDRAREVDDAVQEIMLKVYRSIDRFDGRNAMSTWIYTIARNHCIDLARRQTLRLARVHLSEDIDTLPGSEGQEPLELYLAREVNEEIDAFIETLDPDDRTMLMLRFYEDQPYAQIARVVGRPEGTVKYRIHEIKAGLKSWLEARR
jgi:RNA polymerase sigma-70 factor, ECF subfamily